MKLYGVCHSLSDRFHLALYPLAPSMLSQMARSHPLYAQVIFHCVCVCVCVCDLFFIHSFMDGHLGCFHILTFVSAPVNIGAHISFQVSVFVFFGEILSSGITGSYGNPIFNFLRLHSIFHSGYTSLHSHQQCTRISFSWHLCQYLFVVFFTSAILPGVRWYLIVVLICMTLMMSDVGHLFICLFAI